MMEKPLTKPSVDTVVELWEEIGDEWTWSILLEHSAGDEVVARQARDQIEKLRRIRDVMNRGLPSSSMPNHPDALSFEQLGDVVSSINFSKKELIGTGGLGVVVAYTDKHFNREVAIKFAKRGRAGRYDLVKLLRHEAEITARLDHPGVPPVYAYGETGSGIPFFAMRLVRGNSLQTVIESLHREWSSRTRVQNENGIRELLRHFVTICNVVSYAHERGVIHRDLKPDNIRVDRHGEVIVLDWGVAALTTPTTQRTTPIHSVIELSRDEEQVEISGGTPPYISPEVWQHSPPAPSNDIYAIGVMLYYCVSGSLPIDGKTTSQLEIKHLTGNYVDVDNATSKLGRFPGRHDLGAIVRKAMQIDPSKRYQTTSQIAKDIQSVLSDLPIAIRQAPVSTRFARLIRRQRNAAMLIASLVGLLAVVSTGLTAVTFAENKKRVGAESHANALAIAVSQDRDVLLATMADFAADQVAGELAAKFLYLHQLSEMAILNRLVDEAQTRDPNYRRVLGDFLSRSASSAQGSQQAESIWIQDIKGFQLARFPNAESVGRLFDHRQYFHGGTEDELAAAIPSHPITRRPVVSIVYESSTDQDSYRIAMTYPIKRANEIVGLIGMSVELDQLASLRTGRSLNGIDVTLADWRSYMLDGKQRVGAIIHKVSDFVKDQQKIAGSVSFLPGSLIAADVDETGRWLGNAESIEDATVSVRTAISSLKWRRFDHDLTPLNFKLPPLKIVVQKQGLSTP